MADDRTPVKRWPPAVRLAVAVGISAGLWVGTVGLVYLVTRLAT
ncbi:hypothetical protein [Brevundimonas nasdae]|nr:hypothetical protein [Brevundimonas nasdae]